MLGKKCGTQISKRKVKPLKWKSIFMLATLISLFIGVNCYGIKADKKSIEPYRYARWGMTLEQCEQAVNQLNPESKVVLEEDQKIICSISDYEGRKDIDALVTFACKKDGLEEIEVYIINRKGISYTKDQLIKDYVEMFDALCGEHEKMFNTYTWVAQKSKVQVIDLADNPLIITYQWINKTLY